MSALDPEAHLQLLYAMEERRARFLETLEPSFPPDDARISRGPVSMAWHTPLDDFWRDGLHKPSFLDDSGPAPRFIDEMTPEVFQAAKLQFEKTHQTVKSLRWLKLPTRMGICHGETEPTVCAVHRWESRDIESQEILGRLQCWNDPSLLQWKPTFVLEFPEFSEIEGDGPVCIVEVKDSLLIVGCPLRHSMLYGNTFAFESSHGEDDWDLAISDATTAEWVVSQMSEFGLFAMCQYGGCALDERNSESFQ
jgi:hypothetical protein